MDRIRLATFVLLSLYMKKIFFVTLLIIIGIVVFGQVHSRSIILSAERIRIWEDFVALTIMNNKVDASKYWMLREFGMPGALVFKEQGFSKTESEQLWKMANIVSADEKIRSIFLSKQGDDFVSFDGFTTVESVNDLITNEQFVNAKIDYQGKELVAYQLGARRGMVMVMPISEMRNVNGLFDYNYLRQRFEGVYWFSVSVMTDET